MQLWTLLQATGKPLSCPAPRAALSWVLPAMNLGPSPSGPSVVSHWNPRETRGELTRHARADDVQAHGDGPVGFLREERAVRSTAFERELSGLLPGSVTQSLPTLGP